MNSGTSHLTQGGEANVGKPTGPIPEVKNIIQTLVKCTISDVRWSKRAKQENKAIKLSTGTYIHIQHFVI